MSNIKTLQAPQLNNNGSSKASIEGQIADAYTTGRAFQQALQDMAPHGRDYQTLPTGAFQVARDEHNLRLKRVQEVMDELKALHLAVHRQGH